VTEEAEQHGDFSMSINQQRLSISARPWLICFTAASKLESLPALNQFASNEHLARDFDVRHRSDRHSKSDLAANAAATAMEDYSRYISGNLLGYWINWDAGADVDHRVLQHEVWLDSDGPRHSVTQPTGDHSSECFGVAVWMLGLLVSGFFGVRLVLSARAIRVDWHDPVLCIHVDGEVSGVWSPFELKKNLDLVLPV
jgi:hypothetical protein